MPYKIVKNGKRIIFVPDRGLKDLLDFRKNILRKYVQKNSRISTFAIGDGLRFFLKRHIKAKHRFFVEVDFVHAFHQVSREMIKAVFPTVGDSYYDICFVKISKNEEGIIPTGFSTSSVLFEIFFSKTVDPALLVWAKKHNGLATRSGDNILITWKKNIPEAWKELKQIFENFQVRFTPAEPRKWDEGNPIRFLGVLVHKKGYPAISEKRKKFLLNRAKNKPRSMLGVERFLERWQ